MKKFIIITITLFLSFIITAKVSYAQADDVSVIFTPDPMFFNTNLLPGDTVEASAQVTNNSAETRHVITEASGVADPEDFASSLNLIIEENGVQRYSNTLATFFLEDELFLSDLANGASTTYQFFISFADTYGNSYQGKTLDNFNIRVGIQSTESIGGQGSGEVNNPGSGVSGNGDDSGYQYEDLVISGETTAEVGSTFVTIVWTTNKSATSRVIYDTTNHPDISGEEPPNYGYTNSTVESTLKVTFHAVLVDGLTPGTTYYFRPISSASPETYGEEISFTTMSEDDKIIYFQGEEAPKLEIDKNLSTSFANPGDKNIELNTTIKNTGNSTAYEVKVVNELPDGLIFSDDQSAIKEAQIEKLEPNENKNYIYSINILANAKDGKYLSKISASAMNHDVTTANAELEVRGIKVLGIELTPTGFNLKEFIILLSIIVLLIIVIYFLKKKLKK